MPNGFVNVLKAPGITSHDIVSHLRKVYGIKKIGHAGTLDPAAAGVLPIAIGKATRMLEYMDNVDKTYKAEVTFGLRTDTGDDTGKILEEVEYTLPSSEQIKSVLNSFLGEIEQQPPVYSAIRINGEKAYKLARKNVEVEMPKRKITIHRISFQEMTDKGFIFEVNCSKGTYIRTLCEDIGKKLGIPTVMSFLIRTQVGLFTVENAWSTEEIGLLPHKVLLNVDFPIKHLAKYTLSAKEASDFKQGRRIELQSEIAFSDNQDKFVRLYTDKEFAGIGRYLAKEKAIAPHKVLL